jgi:2-polyprenyl-6-methoxyphenol hydroxylase-like FAD-dependent oxidoreductase
MIEMDVVIAGAGIAGLSAALALHAQRTGDRIRVLEAAPELKPLGVGLNILPSAIAELTALGLYDELAARAVVTAEFALYHRSGGLIWSEPRGVAAGFKWPQLSIHRGHLYEVLAAAVRKRLGAQTIIAGSRVAGFEAAGGGQRVRIHVERQPGEREVIEADLLIGADGLHSAVRATAYPGEGRPRGNGMVMWRGMTLMPPYLTGRTMIVIGDDRQKLVVYPVVPADGQGGLALTNWVTGIPADRLPPGGTDPRQRADEVLKHYAHWSLPWLDITRLVRDAQHILEYPMEDREPLERWVFGRTILIGDAAHPMYPVGSNGATQGIIDGCELAKALARESDPARALELFDADRRPATAGIQAANRRMGPERAIDVVHQRAPNGFRDVHDVISSDELADIARGYSAIAGLDRARATASDRPGS